MPELYLAPWAWVTEGGQSFWQMPRADIGLGCLDLRSLPQCGSPGTQFPMRGWFSLSQQDDMVGQKLGDLGALVGAPMKAALASRLTLDLGENIVASDNIGILVELLNHHADPTGQTRWKPLRGSLRNGMSLSFAGQLIWQDRFDADPVYLKNTIAVFREDYKRNRTLPDTLAGLDKEVWIQSFRTKEERASDTPLTEVEARKRWLVVLRKWIGSTMRSLWGQMSDELAAQLLPTEYRSDGWAIPDTVLLDNFNRIDADAMGSSSEGWSWIELVGDIDIVSNSARSTTLDSSAIARADNDLATDDQYTKALVDVSNAAALARISVLARKDSTATLTFYEYEALFDNNTVQIRKWVNNNLTIIGGPWAHTLAAGTPVNLKGDVDVNSLKLYINDAQQGTTINDTTITNNLRTGIWGYKQISGYVVWDNFEAGDLGAAGRIMGALAGHGGLAGAGGIAGKRGGLAA